MTEHYDVIIIGSGAGGGTLVGLNEFYLSTPDYEWPAGNIQ